MKTSVPFSFRLRFALVSIWVFLFLALGMEALTAATVWRGMGQRMRVTVQGTNGGGAWSRLTRSRHYSSVPFRRFRIVLQTFHPGGSNPICDTNYVSDFVFQVGLEYPYVAGNSGIPARVPVTFGGSNRAVYAAASGPYGYILSDVIDLGFDLPTNAFFGLWTTIENQAGAASVSNSLPYIDNLCNNLERYEGSSAIQGSYVASNAALSNASISRVGTNINGYSAGYAPTMMLIEVDSSEKSIVLIGDSICYGVGEGAGAGSVGYGDALGSALGNSGYLARWLGEKLHYNYVNMGRGSDGFKYASAQNWKYRLQLATLANPTHIVSQNLHNDMYHASGAPGILSNLRAAYQLIRAACPGAPVIQACCTPNTDSSSDAYATLANQVPTALFLSPTGPRNVINEMIRSSNAQVGHDGFIDPNPWVEDGYVAGDTNTIFSKWKVDGTVYAYIYDGVHPNSRSAAAIASGMTRDPFASAGTNVSTNVVTDVSPSPSSGATGSTRATRSVSQAAFDANPVSRSSGAAILRGLPAGATVRIYSVRGAPLATLRSGSGVASDGTLAWPLVFADGSAVPPGVYLLRVESGAEGRTLKLVVSK